MATPIYFSHFPNINYAFKINKAGKAIGCDIKDYFHLMKVRDDLYKYDTVYDNYYVKEAQRPDEVAFELYGDEQYYWVILQINDIIDYWNQWPLAIPELEAFIVRKYGLEGSGDIHHYKTRAFYDSDEVNANMIFPGDMWVSADWKYPTNLGISQEPPIEVTNRQWEYELNDMKREIQVIQPKYIADLVRDYERYAKSLQDTQSEVSISDVKY